MTDNMARVKSMKTIEKDRYPLADEIEKYMQLHGFTFEVGPPMAYDQYGNQYTTLRMEGPFEEGRKEFLRVRATSEKFACQTYEKSLFKFLGNNRHVIWRMRPEVAGMTDGFIEEWGVYSRLTAYPERS
jgi:hypothetical protein